MVKVKGTASYQIIVECVNCKKPFDVVPQDQASEGEITKAMFENTYQSCSNMNLEVCCPYCADKMILDQIRY